MNAMPSGAAFLARHDALAALLPGQSLPWLARLRADAATIFRTHGLPTRRVEAWRYTDLAPVAAASFAAPLAGHAPGLPAPRAAWRAVFIDGRLVPALSVLPGCAAGLSDALPAAEALLTQPELPLVALNTLLFEDGLFLDVPEGQDLGAMELLHITGAQPVASHPRHAIRMGAGAKLTLIETSEGPAGTGYLHNPVFDIRVAADAALTHVRIQREGRSAFQLSTVLAHVAAGGTYDNFTLNIGGRLVRNEIHVTLEGPRAAAHMNGAQLVGDGQHADTTTYLDHAAPDCPSRQTYKTVLAGRSRGVFQGKILVRQAAQRTDGYQMNQALLLSDHSEMDSKPQLEIYADDVKCSHGATVGALDPNQLFYLRARGIPHEEARALLVQAFLTEAVEAVTHPIAQVALAEAVDGWWQREAA